MLSLLTKSLFFFPAALGITYAATLPNEFAGSAQVFDGVYQNNPVPGPTNNATDWWYFQAVGDAIGDIVPRVEVTFFKGYTFTLPTGLSHYLFAVSGVLPNGTAFAKTVFVPEIPTIVTKGQAVDASWTEGAGGFRGGFKLNGDLSKITITLNDTAFAGTIALDRVGAPALTSNNKTITDKASPYFDYLIAKDQPLNSYQNLLFKEAGWAIAFSNAKAAVNLQVGDYKFVMAAKGYQDKNWSPLAFDQFIHTWLVTLGTCGPFAIKFFEGQPKDSKRAMNVVHSGLTYTDTKGTTILQNHNYLYGDSSVTSYLNVTLTGQAISQGSGGLAVPSGQIHEFKLANGTKYRFEFTHSVENPARPVYHRWGLIGKGGRVGGPSYKCNVIGEWLNPGLVPYQEGVNIFGN